MARHMVIRTWIAALFVLGPAIPGVCDIYKYIDENGVMHFTNAPTLSSVEYQIYIKEKSDRPAATVQTGRFNKLIKEASKRHGVSAPLLKAVIKAESNFDPKAVSKKGAVGLMQIMPKNFKSLNIKDPFNPRENIMGGTRYLKRLMDRYRGKLSLAIAAYNAGPEMVDRYMRIPPFKETEEFVKRVLTYYASYKMG